MLVEELHLLHQHPPCGLGPLARAGRHPLLLGQERGDGGGGGLGRVEFSISLADGCVQLAELDPLLEGEEVGHRVKRGIWEAAVAAAAAARDDVFCLGDAWL